jgi:hypothetical protein
MVSMEDLETFLKKLGLGIGNVLLSKLVNELPDRINRVDSSMRSGMCKEVYNEIVLKLKNDVDTWLDQRKKNNE